MVYVDLFKWLLAACPVPLQSLLSPFKDARLNHNIYHHCLAIWRICTVFIKLILPSFLIHEAQNSVVVQSSMDTASYTLFCSDLKRAENDSTTVYVLQIIQCAYHATGIVFGTT